MKRSMSLAAIFTLLAFVLAACSGQSATAPTQPPAPTATQAPTATPKPSPTPEPTATPKPSPTPEPTKAPEPTAEPTKAPEAPKPAAGNSEAQVAILAGLNNIKELKTYRVEMDIRAKGALGELGGADPNQEIQLMAINGDINGKNSRMALKGFFAAFLGADPEKGMEVIALDGKSYVKGPVPMMGANEDKWYIMPADGSSFGDPATQSSQMVKSLSGEDVDLTSFKNAGTEELDGQQCTVYAGDKDATLKAMAKMGSQGLPGAESMNVDNAEMKFWICEDGNFHQMSLNYGGTPKDNPNEKAEMSMILHIYDFDADITIEAPKDPAEIEKPAP